jgi:hypothetical protein
LKGAYIRDQAARQGLMEKTGYCFVYGAEDAAAKTLSNSLYNNALNAQKNNLKLTFQVELKKTKLAGHDLLGKPDELDTEALVGKYLKDKVFAVRKNSVWDERDLKSYPIQEVPLKNYGVSTP